MFGATRTQFLARIGSAVLSLPLLTEVYSRAGASRLAPGGRFPSEPLADPATGWDEVEDVTLVFHGAGGQDQYTDELMKNLEAPRGRGGKSYEAIVDWSAVSGNILQASFNGQRVGRETASLLLSKLRYRNGTPGEERNKCNTVHVIGISVGAFAADSCVTQIKKVLGTRANEVNVQLTLLDPFLQRGVIGVGYGTKTFGRSADYAQQYMNTDDPVPSTNDPCTNCACVDVTALRPKEIFGHDWPLVYYARSRQLGIVPLEQRQEAGSVVVAK
jgi:hypothetical protein